MYELRRRAQASHSAEVHPDSTHAAMTAAMVAAGHSAFFKQPTYAPLREAISSHYNTSAIMADIIIPEMITWRGEHQHARDIVHCSETRTKNETRNGYRCVTQLQMGNSTDHKVISFERMTGRQSKKVKYNGHCSTCTRTSWWVSWSYSPGMTSACCHRR